MRASVSFTFGVGGNGSGSDSDSGSSSSESEDDVPPRRRGKNKKKGGKRGQQDWQPDAGGPFNMDPWANNFAGPPPMWGTGFPVQLGGGFGLSGSSPKSGKGGHRQRDNAFADVSEEAQARFGGFDFKTWQMKPSAVADIFSNMRSGHF